MESEPEILTGPARRVERLQQREAALLRARADHVALGEFEFGVVIGGVRIDIPHDDVVRLIDLNIAEVRRELEYLGYVDGETNPPPPRAA